MTRLAPVLRPQAAAGRGLPQARHLRVHVDQAGALVLDRPDRPRQVLADPRAVTRVLYLEPERARALLGRDASYAGAATFLTGSGPVLTVRLMDWAPPSRDDLDLLRRTTGVLALADALHLPLEPAGADEPGAAALRTVEVRPLAPPVFPGKAVRLLGPLAAFAAFLAWPTGGTAASAVLTALSLLLIAPVVLGVRNGRAAARVQGRLAAQAIPGVLVGVRPAGPVPAACLDHVLALAPEELLLRRRGSAGWLPGPAAGGVVQAVMEPEHVRLADADGRDYAVLETALWCGDQAARAELADDLRAGGLAVLEAPLDTVVAPGDLASAGVHPSALQSELERGDPTATAPYLGGLGALLACGGALGATAWEPAVGLPLLAACLALLGLSLSMTWRRRRDDRAAVRLVDAPRRPVVGAT